MDRPRVAAAVRGMLETGGACAHVNATTHHGVDGTSSLPHPRPPYSAIAELIRLYLGPMRRAGRSFLPHGTVAGEAEIYRAAGFTGPQCIEIPGHPVARTTEDIIAATFSLSSSAPHLFGDRQAEFENDLRRLLVDAGPDGMFSEHTREITIDV